MRDILIRSEKVSEIADIDALLKKVFGDDVQAGLVRGLRDRGALLFSVVAIEKATNQLLGHLALSLASLENNEKAWQVLSLIHIAVDSDYKNKGLESGLMEYWLQEYQDAFYNAVVVIEKNKMAKDNFFEIFGFENISKYGISSVFASKGSLVKIKEIKAGFLTKAADSILINEEVINAS